MYVPDKLATLISHPFSERARHVYTATLIARGVKLMTDTRWQKQKL